MSGARQALEAKTFFRRPATWDVAELVPFASVS